jgi:hypothetical protein
MRKESLKYTEGALHFIILRWIAKWWTLLPLIRTTGEIPFSIDAIANIEIPLYQKVTITKNCPAYLKVG